MAKSKYYICTLGTSVANALNEVLKAKQRTPGEWDDRDEAFEKALTNQVQLTLNDKTRPHEFCAEFSVLKKAGISSRDKVVLLSTDNGFVPFKVAPSPTFDALIDESGRAHLRMRDNCYDFGNFPGFAKFVTGGWFETCVYRELKPYLNNGEILDLRIGFEVAFDAAVRERGQTTFG